MNFKSRIKKILKKEIKGSAKKSNLGPDYKEDLIDVIDAELNAPIESISELAKAISRYIIDDFKDGILSFTDDEINLIDPKDRELSKKVLIEDYQESLEQFIEIEIRKGKIDTSLELANKIINYMQRDIDRNIIQFNANSLQSRELISENKKLQGGQVNSDLSAKQKDLCFVPFDRDDFADRIKGMIERNNDFLDSVNLLKQKIPSNLVNETSTAWANIFQKWANKGLIKVINEKLFSPDLPFPERCFKGLDRDPVNFEEALFYELGKSVPELTGIEKAEITGIYLRTEELIGDDITILAKDSDDFKKMVKGKNIPLVSSFFGSVKRQKGQIGKAVSKQDIESKGNIFSTGGVVSKQKEPGNISSPGEIIPLESPKQLLEQLKTIKLTRRNILDMQKVLKARMKKIPKDPQRVRAGKTNAWVLWIQKYKKDHPDVIINRAKMKELSKIYKASPEFKEKEIKQLEEKVSELELT